MKNDDNFEGPSHLVVICVFVNGRVHKLNATIEGLWILV